MILRILVFRRDFRKYLLQRHLLEKSNAKNLQNFGQFPLSFCQKVTKKLQKARKIGEFTPAKAGIYSLKTGFLLSQE